MKKRDAGRDDTQHTIAILGGGLAGLASAHALTKAGLPVSVYEREARVGGLSRTVEKNGFRFDLGGHRFFTRDQEIESFVRDLLGDELISVTRSSKIYLRNKYFDYPLKPLNAIFGLGVPTTVKILADYAVESARSVVVRSKTVSLEDWVVRKFGRTMYDIYFREYSEKVWGIKCREICATWVDQRIRGLSLAQAVRHAFFKLSGQRPATLADSFLYPARGIGRIAERLREEIERQNRVFTGTTVSSINHRDGRAVSLTLEDRKGRRTVPVDHIVSTIPINRLVALLNPLPSPRIRALAARLKFRDLIIVALMVNRPKLTDQTWIYIPEKEIPFGRIHEPTNWSRAMAPPGKSILVLEFFCFRHDPLWRKPDLELAELATENVARLGFVTPAEIFDHAVVRVPNAYPLFEVGYRKQLNELREFVDTIDNISVAGRSGSFEYYNMDLALRSGIETAKNVIRGCGSTRKVQPPETVLTAAPVRSGVFSSQWQ